MIERIRSKLRGRSGETIGETLVALLISSLALVMLAGAISAAARMVTISKTAVKEYYVSSEDDDKTAIPTSSPIVDAITNAVVSPAGS